MPFISPALTDYCQRPYIQQHGDGGDFSVFADGTDMLCGTFHTANDAQDSIARLLTDQQFREAYPVRFRWCDKRRQLWRVRPQGVTNSRVNEDCDVFDSTYTYAEGWTRAEAVKEANHRFALADAARAAGVTYTLKPVAVYLQPNPQAGFEVEDAGDDFAKQHSVYLQGTRTATVIQYPDRPDEQYVAIVGELHLLCTEDDCLRVILPYVSYKTAYTEQ